jgi:hypothetical protein
VTTLGGTSANNSFYTYAPIPQITSVDPVRGPENGGNPITIYGSGFTGATAVTVGGAAATAVTVVDDATITATAPAGTPGAANVMVVTPGGSISTSAYTYINAPAIDSFDPSAGPLAGNTSVELLGNYLAETSSVTFGGVAATIVSVAAGSVTVSTPARAVGPAQIFLTTPGGTSQAPDVFMYTALPTVLSVSPASGPLAGGTSITIGGTGFAAATAVTIGGVAATAFTIDSILSITATVPPRAIAGSVSVNVTTLGGTSANNSFYSYA